MTNNTRFSFDKGYSQVPRKLAPEVREKLRAALGVKHDSNVHCYRRGELIVNLLQAEKIEEIFHSYGIVDIWGDRLPQSTGSKPELSSL